MLLLLVQRVYSIDRGELNKTPAGTKLDLEMKTNGLIALVNAYEAIWKKVDAHFKARRKFLDDVTNHRYPGTKEEMLDESQLLYEEGNELSSCMEMMTFWHATNTWLKKNDPLRNEPVYLKLRLNYKSPKGERYIIENLAELYRTLTGPTSVLATRDHQELQLEIISEDTDSAVVKISGANAWPYLYREAGLHAWPNQARGTQLHRKEVEVALAENPDGDKQRKLEQKKQQLPSLLSAVVNSSGSSSSSATRILRIYDIRAQTVYTQDTGAMPGPIRANGMNRGGTLYLNDDGRITFASMFQRYANMYYLAIVRSQLPALEPYLPKADDGVSP